MLMLNNTAIHYNTTVMIKKITEGILPVNNSCNAAFSKFHHISCQRSCFVRKNISNLDSNNPPNISKLRK